MSFDVRCSSKTPSLKLCVERTSDILSLWRVESIDKTNLKVIFIYANTNHPAKLLGKGVAMIVETFFEDYEIGSARKTFGRTITEADIVLHAGHTGDFFPHHMDREWCATQDFSQRIAHGTLVFSVGIGMTASTINPRAMSYGYDRLRFIRPVHIGDTISVTATIAAKRDHPKRKTHGFVDEAIEIVNQRGEAVLVCQHIYLVERRPAV